VRCHLFEMRGRDVVEIVGALTAAGISASIAGGWGVDALLGRQSRRHKDLDLIVDASDAAQATARRVLHDLGYEAVDNRAEAGKWMPLKVVLRDPGGRTIDLLPVHFEGGATGPDAEAAAAPLGPAAFVSGVVAGHPVSCLSPWVQLTFHTEYAPRRIDRRDVALLSSRFGSAARVSYT
jgi:lincosamide nucleotidyltransferase A/C/D/E